MKSLKSGAVPTKISEVTYFVKEHREVPNKLIAENPEVKSISFCDTCHTDAEIGGYREGKINIISTFYSILVLKIVNALPCIKYSITHQKISYLKISI